ncbi:MAG: ATP-binding cassette domain-containing protein [Thermoanaerobaculia bacterium]|nr:ATP-binding cassette domain-containing protein [Thermoanaerobaculia bacterium]
MSALRETARAADVPQDRRRNLLEVVDLGKRFRHRSPVRPQTLQERCIGRHQEKGPHGEFWGLRHVSFTLAPGSATAIVGANGAGKSTLLRLLCGIGRPDEGGFRLAGKVNAMLDLDAGFHSELTGRENVFVSAMIAGLRRAQVARLMDEIVAFSGLDGFIDDPLRTYSSGMRVRLGFAVAVALIPKTDLLLVDEVLAVGDAEFSARCLERIGRFRDAGGSVLVVSHSMSLVLDFCDRALWLRGGHVARFDAAPAVVADYLAAEAGPAAP